MKKFYSNVSLTGDTIFYIGYENGERVQYKDSFSPVLFVPCKEDTVHKTLEGYNAKPIEFSNVKDAKEFLDKYREVENFNVYGNDSFKFKIINLSILIFNLEIGLNCNFCLNLYVGLKTIYRAYKNYFISCSFCRFLAVNGPILHTGP